MSECFPRCKANVKIGLDLSNYVTKENLKMQQMLIHQNSLER